METDKALEKLEEEFKLMKGELKETISSVRDYLLNTELPASEYANIMAALGTAGNQQMEVKGDFSLPKDQGEPMEEVIEEEIPDPESELTTEEAEPESESPTDEQAEEGLGQDSETPPEDLAEEGAEAESELPPEEEQHMETQTKIVEEAGQSPPEVNLLSNLIHWVAKAKNEIGTEQLPTFLEVYGLSGHLSPELKDIILNLANIASEPTDMDSAGVWGQLILSLHGILTGGDAPLHPVRPFWADAKDEINPGETETEEDKPKDQPLKLKLVLSNSNGKEQEYSIDLNPTVEEKGLRGIS